MKTEIQKYSELKIALKSKFNLLLFFIGAIVLGDYLMGYPVGLNLSEAYFKMRGISGTFKFFAIFGKIISKILSVRKKNKISKSIVTNNSKNALPVSETAYHSDGRIKDLLEILGLVAESKIKSLP